MLRRERERCGQGHSGAQAWSERPRWQKWGGPSQVAMLTSLASIFAAVLSVQAAPKGQGPSEATAPAVCRASGLWAFGVEHRTFAADRRPGDDWRSVTILRDRRETGLIACKFNVVANFLSGCAATLSCAARPPYATSQLGPKNALIEPKGEPIRLPWPLKQESILLITPTGLRFAIGLPKTEREFIGATAGCAWVGPKLTPGGLCQTRPEPWRRGRASKKRRAELGESVEVLTENRDSACPAQAWFAKYRADRSFDGKLFGLGESSTTTWAALCFDPAAGILSADSGSGSSSRDDDSESTSKDQEIAIRELP